MKNDQVLKNHAIALQKLEIIENLISKGRLLIFQFLKNGLINKVAEERKEVSILKKEGNKLKSNIYRYEEHFLNPQ